MKKYNYVLWAFIGAIVVLCEVLAFLYLDKYNHLHKGISARKYEILPFYTKIEGDHNSSGYFTFAPIYKNGLRLETTLILGNINDTIPTIVYDKPSSATDTIFLSWIKEYGYNEKKMVINALTTDNTIVWLQPMWIKKKIHIIKINEDEIDKKAYQWIMPTSQNAQIALIIWILLLVILPISLIVELYLIVNAFIT